MVPDDQVATGVQFGHDTMKNLALEVFYAGFVHCLFDRLSVYGLMKVAVQKRALKSLVNTPLKKAMFGIQILSYILIVGSPFIGGAIGGILKLNAGQIAGVILGILITGEILFYGSLAFLGKELILICRIR
jgi:hypothetical protein